jgi:hypothetical protein
VRGQISETSSSRDASGSLASVKSPGLSVSEHIIAFFFFLSQTFPRFRTSMPLCGITASPWADIVDFTAQQLLSSIHTTTGEAPGNSYAL